MVKITYKPGDKVFAKVKGYPPWPAEVVSEAGKKYNVLFYGTKEVGAIKPEDMFFYLKHKDSYVHKYVKRAGYEDAVKQIEEAISKTGGDGNSSTGPENEETILESDILETPTTKKVVKRKVTSLPAPIDSARKAKGRRRSAALSDQGDVSEEPALKKARRKSVLPSESGENKTDLSESSSNIPVKSAVPENGDLSELNKEQDTVENVKDETTITDQVLDNTAKGDSESVFISLEKEPQEQPEENNTISKTVSTAPKEEREPEKEGDQKEEQVPKKSLYKEVKMSQYQLTLIKIVTDQVLNQYIKYAEHVRKHPDLFNGPVETRIASEHDVLPVQLPSGTIAGIKLHKKWPVEHETERERAFYDERLAKDALDAKKLLSEGTEVDVEVIPDIGKTTDDIKEITYTHDIEAKRTRLKRLKKEIEVLGWDVKIRDSLGLEKADPDAAFTLLKEFYTLKKHIDNLTLRKHPHILDTIRRLRKYIGNVKEWIMTQEDQHIFMRKAEKIRNLAEDIYSSLKEMFDVDEDKVSFWEGFMEQVTEFRTKCKDLSENEMLLLCSEPDSREAFMDRLNEIPDTETALIVNAPEAAALVR